MKGLEKLAGGLELAFFALAFLALVVGIAGSPGWGLFLLVLAGAAQVGRAALEEVGMVRADGRSRALPILRRAGADLRRGAAIAWRQATVAWQTVRSAR